MGALKQAKSFNTADINLMNGDTYVVNAGSPSGVYVPSVNQGLPTLIVMVVVLVIIILFCFWGAPAIRAFCKRKICCCCPMDEPNMDNVSTADGSTTPTIILLPYGRMLVVDRNIFTQLQADRTGIDFMELSANLIRAQNLHNASNPSMLESEDTSKGLSPTSLDFLPPAYEDIFGVQNSDLPPSYSEISLMLRKLSDENLNNVQVVDNEDIITAKPHELIWRTSSAPFILNGLFEFNRELRRDFVSLEKSIERNLLKNKEVADCESTTDLFDEGVSERPSGTRHLQPSNKDKRRSNDDAQFSEYVDRESSV